MSGEGIMIHTDGASLCADPLEGAAILTVMAHGHDMQITLPPAAVRVLGAWFLEQAAPAQALEAAE